VWAVGGPVGARGEPGRGEGKNESWGRQCHLEFSSRDQNQAAIQTNSSERPENVTAG
jgi:hypothetical protein